MIELIKDYIGRRMFDKFSRRVVTITGIANEEFDMKCEMFNGRLNPLELEIGFADLEPIDVYDHSLIIYADFFKNPLKSKGEYKCQHILSHEWVKVENDD